MNSLTTFVAMAAFLTINFGQGETTALAAQHTEQPAREIPSKEIKKLKKRVIDKYSRMGFPYSLITEVSGKLTHGNVNGILGGWYAIPAESRGRIIAIFQAYGLEDFIFLFMYESAGKTDLVNKSSGARGLFQITPATANEHCGIGRDQLDILLDPETNAACAVAILVDKNADENWKVGVIRYNGQFLRCKMRGYLKCVHELSRSENPKVARAARGSLLYFLNFLLYKEVGKEFILN